MPKININLKLVGNLCYAYCICSILLNKYHCRVAVVSNLCMTYSTVVALIYYSEAELNLNLNSFIKSSGQCNVLLPCKILCGLKTRTVTNGLVLGVKQFEQDVQ